MKKNSYDVVVIGAGSGGLNVASFFAGIQMRVLLIDKQETSLGGDCLNTGCIPSKALIHAASLVKAARTSQVYGLELSGRTDIKKVMDEIRSKQEVIRAHETSDALIKKGMNVRLGHVQFTGKNTLSINDEEIIFSKCVLATGSRARTLTTKSDGSVQMFSNESIFDIDVLPEEFIFIGGGPIGCEIGQAFARFGSHVTMLHTQDRILPREVSEVSTVVASSMKEDGVTIISNAVLSEIKEGQVLYITEGSSEIKSISADAVFVGIGRVLNIEGLDLEKAGIICDEKKTKLSISKYLQTSNPRVYAVGDVAGSFMFTHAAEEHAKVVINNILSPFKKKMPSVMPWVTFTDPQVGTFGTSIEDLQKAGIPYETLETTFKDDDRAVTDDARNGFVRVYLDRKGRLLGGTMVGEDAGELIGELLLLHSLHLPLSNLFNKVYPYPSKSRINRRLVLSYMKRKLSERGKGLVRILFRIFK